MDRRRKFWGWGFEDQQPPDDEVAAAAAGAREHLGFAPAEVERPARLEDIELRPPRIEPPASLAHICAADRYERVTHAYGKAYRDIVRALPRPLRQPARRRRAPAPARRTSSECSPGARRRARRRSRSAAARAWSAASSRRRTGRRCRSTSARSTACSRWTRSRARRASRPGRSGPRLEDQLREHGLHAAPLPAVVRVLDAGRLDRHPRGRPLRHALHAHRRPRGVGARASRRAGVWESRRLPGSGAGPSPDRMLIGSEGILGVITEAWMRVQEAPRFRESAARDLRLVRGRRRGGARAVAVAASTRRTAACSTRRRGRADRRAAPATAAALLVLGFESADHELGPWMTRRSSSARTTAGGRGAARASAASPRAPGATPSSRRPTCATR